MVMNAPPASEEQLPNFEGAIVLEPSVGLHCSGKLGGDDRMVDVVTAFPNLKDKDMWVAVQVDDFSALYPTTMRSLDICFSNLNLKGEAYEYLKYNYSMYANALKEGDTASAALFKAELNFDNHMACFRKQGGGVLPRLLAELKDLRSAYKAKAKAAKREGRTSDYDVFQNAQLAVKVVTNSCYGACGTATGYYPCNVLAAATTAGGRDVILLTKKLLEEPWDFHIDVDGVRRVRCTTDKMEWARRVQSGDCILDIFLEVVYGDTDSCFARFTSVGTQPSKAVYDAVGDHQCTEVTRKINEHYKSMGFERCMQDLEQEKTYYNWIIWTKKRYAGWKVMFGDAYDQGAISSSGIKTARRDVTPFVRNMLKTILHIVIVDRDPDKALNHVAAELERARRRQVPIEEYVLTIQINETYKNPNLPGACIKARSAELGFPVLPPTRVPFYYGASVGRRDKKAALAEPFLKGSPLVVEKFELETGFDLFTACPKSPSRVKIHQRVPCHITLIKDARNPIVDFFQPFSTRHVMEVKRLFAKKILEAQNGVPTQDITSFFSAASKRKPITP